MAQSARNSRSAVSSVEKSAVSPTVAIVTDGAGIPVVPAAVSAKKKITRSIVGDVITWNIPGFTGDAPTLDRTKCTAEIRAYAEMHGFGARVTDSAAQPMEDSSDGKGKIPASPDEKAAAIRNTIAVLYSGKWKSDRGISVGDGVLMEAINEIDTEAKRKPRFADLATYQQWCVDGAANSNCTVAAFVTQMEANQKIAPRVSRIRQAKLANVKFDTEKFLAI